jgi:hypothetical protein
MDQNNVYDKSNKSNRTFLTIRLFDYRIIRNYLEWFSISMYQESQNHVGFLCDPRILVILVVAFSLFVGYSVCSFVSKSLGLFYPSYHVYHTITMNNKESMDKLKIMIKYFVLYSHLELLETLFQIMGLQWCFLKMITIIVLLYITFNESLWINIIYEKIILYDRLLLNACYYKWMYYKSKFS